MCAKPGRHADEEQGALCSRQMPQSPQDTHTLYQGNQIPWSRGHRRRPKASKMRHQTIAEQSLYQRHQALVEHVGAGRRDAASDPIDLAWGADGTRVCFKSGLNFVFTFPSIAQAARCNKQPRPGILQNRRAISRRRFPEGMRPRARRDATKNNKYP